MRRAKRSVQCAVIAAAAAVFAVPMAAQDAEVVGHHAQSDGNGGIVTFDLANGGTLSVELADGVIRVNGEEVGTYDANGQIASEWTDLVESARSLSTGQLHSAIGEWQREAAGDRAEVATAIADAMESVRVSVADQVDEAITRAQQRENIVVDVGSQSGIARLAEQLRDLESLRGLAQAPEDFRLDLSDATVYWGDVSVEAGETVAGALVVLHGDARIRGTVSGNVLATNGNVRLYPGARVEGDVTAVDGRVVGDRDLVLGEIRTVRSAASAPEVPPSIQSADSPFESGARSALTLLGLVVALASIGFGVTFFGHDQLELIAQRIIDSPGRSFLAGFFAQPLILPLIVTLVIALAVSVIGIVVIPFAVLGAVLAIGAAVVVGYLAIARVIGAHYARQRSKTSGSEVSLTPYQAMVRGLVIVLAVWLPVVFLGWIPLAGPLATGVAAIFTWLLITTGFGAVITTRAGGALDRWTPTKPRRVTAGDRWATGQEPVSRRYRSEI